MTLFTTGDGNTPLSPDEQADLIPDLTTKEELNEWERQNILEAAAWAFAPFHELDCRVLGPSDVSPAKAGFAADGLVARRIFRDPRFQPPPVAASQRRPDGVERMRESADDAAGIEILGARLDIPGVDLKPLMVAGIDPKAQDVHGLRLAVEARRQLFRDERPGQIGDRQCAIDRVVVGDRHKVHATALCELVHLVRRGCAFGQSECPLNPQA